MIQIRDTPWVLGLVVGMSLAFVCQQSEAASAVPTFATEHSEAWHFRYRLWATLHYGLGLVSVVLSVASAAYKSASVSTKAALAIGAAVAAGVLTFLNPSPNAKAFHRVWVDMEGAILDYQHSATPNVQNLVDAVKNAEKFLREAGVI